MNSFIDTSKMVKLDTLWVIIKRYDSFNYYYGSIDPTRPNKYAASSKWKNAKNAFLYSNREDAEEVCKQINSNRKKLKMRVDNAANHFISNFELGFQTWGDKLIVTNRFVSIQDFKEKKLNVNFNFSQDNIKLVLENLKDIQKRTQQELIETPNRLNQQIKQMQVDLEQRIAYATQNANNRINTAEQSLKNIDEGFKFIDEQIKTNILSEANKTNNDDKFKLLYGKLEV